MAIYKCRTEPGTGQLPHDGELPETAFFPQFVSTNSSVTTGGCEETKRLEREHQFHKEAKSYSSSSSSSSFETVMPPNWRPGKKQLTIIFFLTIRSTDHKGDNWQVNEGITCRELYACGINYSPRCCFSVRMKSGRRL